MSFAEQNKRWLLPVLGLALAGVVWINLSARTPASSGDAAGPAGNPPDEAPPDRPPATEAGDLRALQAPSVEDNDTVPLLLAGRQPLDEALRTGPRRPALHPEAWAGLAEAPAPPAPPPAPGASPAPATSPRSLDFTLESGNRQEVWVGGRAYRPGDSLPGGYRLRGLAPGGAMVAGPGGDRLLPLNPPPAAPAPATAGDPP
jgi:hypothetical protein